MHMEVDIDMANVNYFKPLFIILVFILIYFCNSEKNVKMSAASKWSCAIICWLCVFKSLVFMLFLHWSAVWRDVNRSRLCAGMWTRQDMLCRHLLCSQQEWYSSDQARRSRVDQCWGPQSSTTCQLLHHDDGGFSARWRQRCRWHYQLSTQHHQRWSFGDTHLSG